MKKQKQIDSGRYISGGFINRWQRLIKDTVIPYQYDVLNDRAEGAEKSHVVQNFINAAKALRGEDVGDGFYGMVFQDSDAAKWLEAAAFSLISYPDKALEKTADELIDIIAEAQDEDGYLNTYFTIKDREKRWTNLLEGHELYCSGHMMEAACAYYEATGKDKLLKVMEKNAEHIYDIFITQGREGYPGHPEVELALMKMYRLTGNRHCLELAEHFVNNRGVDTEFYKREKAARDWTVWGNNAEDNYYQQSFAPLKEQNDAVGHSVRAVYLYTGAADVASENGDVELMAACRRLWESITKRRMYITGGIGSTLNGEAFTVDYDLPNDTAYNETCASIGLMFFASRMLESDVDGEYADVMERAFYNTVLAGVQLDGTKFFYCNPLEIIPGISACASTHWHTKTQRPGWHTCACCPPNAARLISSIGKYAYGENESTCYCHLYADGEVSFANGVKLTCKTEYPYGFTVNYSVAEGSGRMAVRIPAWSREYSLTKNGTAVETAPEMGYVYVDITAGDELALTLDDTPRYVYASAKVPELTGCTAITRGPLVYCFEGKDNGDILPLSLKRGGKLTVSDDRNEALDGAFTITAEAYRSEDNGSLYSFAPLSEIPCEAVAIPYYTWGNRGENQMRVWMTEVR